MIRKIGEEGKRQDFYSFFMQIENQPRAIKHITKEGPLALPVP